MALTPAEKQRRCRAKRDSDPEKRQVYQAKEKQTYESKKREGKIIPISSLSSRDKRKKSTGVYIKELKGSEKGQKNIVMKNLK